MSQSGGDTNLARRTAAFLSPHRRWVFVSLGLLPVMTAAELAQPVLIKIAIDQHIATGRPDGLATIAIGYMLLVAGQNGVAYAQLYTMMLAGLRATRDLRLAAHKHVLNLRAAYFDKHPVGRIMTRITSDVDNIQEMFASGVITFVADILKLVGIVGMLLWLEWRLALVTFAVLPVLFVLVEVFRRALRNAYRAVRSCMASLNAYLQEHVGGMKVVQAFNQEEATARRFGELNDDYRRANLASIRADATLYALVEMLGIFAVAAVIWYGGGRLLEGVLTFGLLVAFIEYVNMFFVPVRDLSSKYAVMQSGMASAERVFGLLDTHEPDAPVSTVGADPTPAAPGDVRFDNVSFAYTPDEPILKGISFHAEPGTMVAIVGSTGSGKSTLIKLLARLYEPTGGLIRVGGHDVTTLAPAEVRRRVTVIPQDGFLFSGTVRDNLVGAGRTPDPARLRAAMERVHLDRVLARRGAGLDAPVAERGANFSTGERQLVAFTRALLEDPDVVVLDEATSSVDPETEAWMDDALGELLKGRTSLVIAHRLATIRRARRILVMKEGHIVEDGSHDELVALGGAYAHLYELSRLTAHQAAG